MCRKNKRRLWLLFGILVLLLLAAAATAAQAQEDCLPCHGEQGSRLDQSVHAILSCTNCHADVKAEFPHPEGTKINKKESVATCTANCHQGLVADSYTESFHGKAVALGSQRSATCVDCHGAHDVLSQRSPDSKVAKANVAQTCAKCHDQASPGFAEGSEHFKFAATGPGAPMYYTAKFFVWLTLLTIVALVIHIELQLYHDLRTILRERRKT